MITWEAGIRLCMLKKYVTMILRKNKNIKVSGKLIVKHNIFSPL